VLWLGLGDAGEAVEGGGALVERVDEVAASVEDRVRHRCVANSRASQEPAPGHQSSKPQHQHNKSKHPQQHSKSWRRRSFDRARKSAGIDRVTPYALRHSFASLLLHEGRSVIYVARQLGHDARLTLTRYGHVIDELEDQPRASAEASICAARTRVPSPFPAPTNAAKPAPPRNDETPAASGGSEAMELGGLEPPTSWVRSKALTA
jgi:Phage integrase family